MKEKGIPEGLPTLIIAGAKEPFTDDELYQIDQFLMKGRNLAFFMDSFNEVTPPQQMMRQSQGPIYIPVNTGLEKLLLHYGAKVKASYLLDSNCYRQEMPRAFGGGERALYFAPIIKNEFINRGLDFLKNIKGLVLLKTSPVEVDEERIKDHGISASKLFSSSEKSWEMSGRINLNPMMMQPPQSDEDFQQVALAYTLEGSFPSYFADKPVPVREEKKEAPGDPERAENKERGIDMSQVRSEETTLKKGKPGKIFLIGTSEILKDNMLDEEGRTPNAQFVLNMMDALNDREDYAVMRSKSQRFNPLRDVRPGTRTLIKTVNIAGLPLLVIIAGMIVWLRRSSRKRLIQQIFTR
jgi:ABC-2 type transport system permease protein